MNVIFGQTIYGTEVLTLINKAMDINYEKNYTKDDNGFYVDDSAIKIDICFLLKNEEGETTEKVTRAETLEKAGLTKFVSNFGLTYFKCTEIKYNKDKLINYIQLKQIEL